MKKSPTEENPPRFPTTVEEVEAEEVRQAREGVPEVPESLRAEALVKRMVHGSVPAACFHHAISDWMALGGMEPIMDDLAQLVQELLDHCRDIPRDDLAEDIYAAGHDHPWTKIEETLLVAGYEAGRISSENA